MRPGRRSSSGTGTRAPAWARWAGTSGCGTARPRSPRGCRSSSRRRCPRAPSRAAPAAAAAPPDRAGRARPARRSPSCPRPRGRRCRTGRRRSRRPTAAGPARRRAADPRATATRSGARCRTPARARPPARAARRRARRRRASRRRPSSRLRVKPLPLSRTIWATVALRRRGGSRRDSPRPCSSVTINRLAITSSAAREQRQRRGKRAAEHLRRPADAVGDDEQRRRGRGAPRAGRRRRARRAGQTARAARSGRRPAWRAGRCGRRGHSASSPAKELSRLRPPLADQDARRDQDHDRHQPRHHALGERSEMVDAPAALVARVLRVLDVGDDRVELVVADRLLGERCGMA